MNEAAEGANRDSLAEEDALLEDEDDFLGVLNNFRRDNRGFQGNNKDNP